jgi:hypothetical protein
VLFEYGTGCECHPSNQTLQCPVVTIRCYPWSAGNQGVIKRLLLVDRHRRSRLSWCLARRGRNFKTWCKIHWSNESRFLYHVTDDRMRVWGLALSSIYTGLVASGWLSKWGTTTGCKTSLMYCSPVRLPCMVTKSILQSREIHLTTGHCSFWLDGCHSQPVLYSSNIGCPIDVCQQEQLETVPPVGWLQYSGSPSDVQ